jgi:4-amino-4-deoxy-L-arabinose transferase-like glycosyltransferase
MNALHRNNFVAIGLIAGIAALLFIPFTGDCHLFDWDEVNFAECAREMIVSGDYSHVQINYQPFWEKPPVFIWMQAASMQLFGVNEFGARFPNALCGIVTLVTLFIAGKRFHSREFGVNWCLLYSCAFLPHLYFKSGLIDPWFNLFIFLSVYQCILVINNPVGRAERRRALAAGLFLGLAVLTKGPAALAIAGLLLGAYLVWTRSARFMNTLSFGIFCVTTLLVSFSWFIAEIARGNSGVVAEFISYQLRLFETGDAGHDGPWLYHAIVLLLGCFPVSLLFLASYRLNSGLTPFQLLWRKLLLCLFWVVLVLFSIVKTKIVHYSSLCYFPLTFIAAIGISVFPERIRFNRWHSVLFWVITCLVTFAWLAISTLELYKDQLMSSGIVADEFARLSLSAEVAWNGFEWMTALFFLGGSLLLYRGVRRHRMLLVSVGLALQLIFVVLAIAVIVPKAEMYTQHAAISFYKSCAGRDCDLETHSFKSYAYLFYSKRMPSDFQNPHQLRFVKEQLDAMENEGHSRLTSYATSNQLWMEYGKIDRPAYIVAKTPDEPNVLQIPGMRKLYSLNGFTFFVRLPTR